MKSWWSAATKTAFEERKQGMIEQYDGYSFPGIGSVNGALTVGENIADNGGIKAAFRV